MNEYHEYPMWDATLPLEERLNDLIARLTTEEKIRLIPTREAAVPRLGIPGYNVGGEAAHGVAWIGKLPFSRNRLVCRAPGIPSSCVKLGLSSEMKPEHTIIVHPSVTA
ncbi:hypothetical protein [Paenibacillus sp. 1A_MP2]|uniref:hypothetical protein n=1 Tax=Paenibacillus sp. 1A_MP2 TaxID=3457495 RepID=UPI003FCC7FD4